MAPDPNELRRLNRERQYYFLPYYIDVVSDHPEGITAADAKAAVAQHLLQQFEIDIADPAHSGLNPSTGKSQADQWANNLISNDVLDEHMLVVRGGRAVLYPGSDDNSRTEAPPGPALTASQISVLNGRLPARIRNRSTSTYQRSLQLAEHVRSLSGRKCAVDSPSSCVPFDGRDGQAYVEVHHVIPMAQQSSTSVNLDRVVNMVPVCPRCHSCLHRGAHQQAAEVLSEILRWFSAIHGRTFSDANGALGFDVAAEALLVMYGAMS